MVMGDLSIDFVLSWTLLIDGVYVTEIPLLMKMECEGDRSGQISVGWGYKPSLSKINPKIASSHK